MPSFLNDKFPALEDGFSQVKLKITRPLVPSQQRCGASSNLCNYEETGRDIEAVTQVDERQILLDDNIEQHRNVNARD